MRFRMNRRSAAGTAVRPEAAAVRLGRGMPEAALRPCRERAARPGVRAVRENHRESRVNGSWLP